MSDERDIDDILANVVNHYNLATTEFHKAIRKRDVEFEPLDKFEDDFCLMMEKISRYEDLSIKHEKHLDELEKRLIKELDRHEETERNLKSEIDKLEKLIEKQTFENDKLDKELRGNNISMQRSVYNTDELEIAYANDISNISSSSTLIGRLYNETKPNQ